MHAIRRSAAFAVSLVVLAAPLAAFAQIPTPIVPCSGIDCTVCDLAQLAQNILNAGIFIAVFMTGILFAWAGFLMLTSSISDQISKARKLFLHAGLGLVTILAAWLIVDTLMKTLLGGTFGPWNAVCAI